MNSENNPPQASPAIGKSLSPICFNSSTVMLRSDFAIATRRSAFSASRSNFSNAIFVRSFEQSHCSRPSDLGPIRECLALWKMPRVPMGLLFKEIRHNPLLWLLVFVPAVFVTEKLKPGSHTLLFVLSILAILPLAVLLSHATESVAAKTGDSIGGVLNGTLGNLTELVIALAALRAGEYTLVKASVAGAIVTNTLFMLGGSFLLGGLRYHVQEYNRASARMQAGLLFLATIALLVPSAIAEADSATNASFTSKLSVSLSILLIVTYGLGMLFSLKTHRELFASAGGSGEAGEAHDETPWPMGVALVTLAGVTVLVALVSEVFVESVQKAAESFGMSAAFVGFIVVALVG